MGGRGTTALRLSVWVCQWCPIDTRAPKPCTSLWASESSLDVLPQQWLPQSWLSHGLYQRGRELEITCSPELLLLNTE